MKHDYAPELTAYLAMVSDLYRKHGMTQAQIAKGAGVSTTTVWLALTGQVKFPAYSTVEKIKALHARVVSTSSNPSQRVS